jgi:methylase of polypeptide subunit release factors
MDAADRALVELGQALQAQGYRFATVTPETHARVLAADPRPAADLRDIFGWGRSFRPEVLPPVLRTLARRANVLIENGSELRASVRFSSLDDRLFVHSAFPTDQNDSVFFGPDTYRFSAFVQRNLASVGTLVDIGAGSGAGGIMASHRAKRLVLGDVNERALRYARVNAKLAGVDAEVVASDVLSRIEGPIDAVIANPPYLRDREHRLYRDGGGDFGEGLAVRIVRESLSRLAPGGVLLLYTGAPMIQGHDVIRGAVEPLCRAARATLSYEELDPDVFGSEIGTRAYAGVERIAAVGMTARLP